MFCYNCGFEIMLSGKAGRQQRCPECGANLHCCRNCVFYAVNAYHQCRETESEFVQDKKSANFCAYFKPSDKKPGTKESRSDEARKKLDDLFGGGGGS